MIMTQPSLVSALIKLAGSDAGKRWIVGGLTAEGILHSDD